MKFQLIFMNIQNVIAECYLFILKNLSRYFKSASE